MRIMQLLWKADASVNVCPSIHCQSTACMAMAFSQQHADREQASGCKVLAWVWAALICASTVFTKQHSVIDVACGLAVAFVWAAGGVPPAWGTSVEQNSKKLPLIFGCSCY